jgi:hypothetical protein
MERLAKMKRDQMYIHFPVVTCARPAQTGISIHEANADADGIRNLSVMITKMKD